jgi:hypothetical protein
MEELIELIKVYEERNGTDCINVRIFSDGSGQIHDWDKELLVFDTLEEMKEFLDKK